jgi:hypothetical protein
MSYYEYYELFTLPLTHVYSLIFIISFWQPKSNFSISKNSFCQTAKQHFSTFELKQNKPSIDDVKNLTLIPETWFLKGSIQSHTQHQTRPHSNSKRMFQQCCLLYYLRPLPHGVWESCHPHEYIILSRQIILNKMVILTFWIEIIGGFQRVWGGGRKKGHRTGAWLHSNDFQLLKRDSRAFKFINIAVTFDWTKCCCWLEAKLEHCLWYGKNQM